MRRICCLVALIAAIVANGCSSSGPVLPVNGIVTMDNRPLDGATVTFIPETTGVTTVGSAQTGSDGKFVIAGLKGEGGLSPGKYKVTVSKMKVRENSGSLTDPAAVGAVTEADSKDDLPAVYSSPSLTKLSYSVTGDGKPIEIKLNSKGK